MLAVARTMAEPRHKNLLNIKLPPRIPLSVVKNL
jgi:hypothetical protein